MPDFENPYEFPAGHLVSGMAVASDLMRGKTTRCNVLVLSPEPGDHGPGVLARGRLKRGLPLPESISTGRGSALHFKPGWWPKKSRNARFFVYYPRPEHAAVFGSAIEHLTAFGPADNVPGCVGAALSHVRVRGGRKEVVVEFLQGGFSYTRQKNFNETPIAPSVLRPYARWRRAH